MKMRAQYYKRVRVIAARNMARARREGWFRYVRVSHKIWGNTRAINRLRVTGIRQMKLVK